MEQRVGNYTLKKKLGQGGFGQVYLVQDPQGRKYAAKVLQITRQQIQSQLREAFLQLALEHRYLLKARDFFIRQAEQQMVIIMDYCQQGNLATIIGNGKLRSHGQIVQRLMYEICQGLKYIHDRNIVHRDLKPQNIMLSDNHPQITDYGLSKVVTAQAMTMGIGTPHYFPPELLLSDHYDQSADIWSLGIIFLELFLDKRIFQMLQGAEYPCRRPNFPSREMIQALPNQNARNLIVAMLKKDPKDRPGIDEIILFIQKENLFKEEEAEITLEVKKKRDLYVVGTDQGVFVVGVDRLEVEVKANQPRQPDRRRDVSPPPKPAQPAKPKQREIMDAPRPSPSPATIPKPKPKPQPPRQPSPPPPAPKPVVSSNKTNSRKRQDGIRQPLLMCPGCTQPSNSEVVLKAGNAVWGWFACLLVTVPVISLLPFVLDKCKDKQLVCVRCGCVKDSEKGRCF